MNAIRPGTASRLKTAQIKGQLGITSRLTTGLRPGTLNEASGTGTLNTMLCVEDRPITQQGLGGLKNAIRGPKRQIEDKSYFLGLLRGKINELNSEIGTIIHQLMETEEENASFVQYEQMAEKLAYEIKQLQGELSDYNTLVDKATLGDNITSIEMDWEEVHTANERAERNLEILFEDRQRRELSLKSIELEMKQEQQMSETVIHEMNDNERERYSKLKDLNTHLLNQLSQGQTDLEQLNTRKIELEEALTISPIKQEAMRLLSQLHEVEGRRDQLLADEASKEDPHKERQRLLQQVRSDNQEIAAIEKQTHEIQEKITKKEEELCLLRQELDESCNERNQKYRELRRREHQIDEFLKTFDSVKSLEIVRISGLQSNIIEILEKTSNYITNLNQITRTFDLSTLSLNGIINQDESNIQQQQHNNNNNNNNNNNRTPANMNNLHEQINESDKSEETMNSLTKQRLCLSQELLKIDHLENKILQEMESLRKHISKMEEEIVIFSDLEKVREDANLKKQTLNTEKSRFEMYRDNLNKMNQQLTIEYTNLQTNLSEQDIYAHLTNLERRWIQHEQMNYNLNEFIANKRLEIDHSHLVECTMELVKKYNENLKTSLSTKSVIV
ncbi:unnamed protein product [Heterobilharzia americana]|nr:unnamed protein product [Heterobilharzia americana]